MKIKYYLLSMLLIASSTVYAQGPPPGGPMGGPMGPPPGGPGGGGHREGGGPPPGGDKLMENFFPGDLVMRNQRAINLTAEQQTSIRNEMQKTMSRFYRVAVAAECRGRSHGRARQGGASGREAGARATGQAPGASRTK